MTLLKNAPLLIACTLGAISLNSSAAPAVATAPAAPAGGQNSSPMGPMPMPMFFPPSGRPMMMPHGPGFCHGGEVFCASVQSDNPGETIQKLNSILPPAAAGSHYEVRVSVVKVPDRGPDKGDGHQSADDN